MERSNSHGCKADVGQGPLGVDSRLTVSAVNRSVLPAFSRRGRGASPSAGERTFLADGGERRLDRFTRRDCPHRWDHGLRQPPFSRIAGVKRRARATRDRRASTIAYQRCRSFQNFSCARLMASIWRPVESRHWRKLALATLSLVPFEANVPLPSTRNSSEGAL
jgi:hypothetical protein